MHDERFGHAEHSEATKFDVWIILRPLAVVLSEQRTLAPLGATNHLIFPIYPEIGYIEAFFGLPGVVPLGRTN